MQTVLHRRKDSPSYTSWHGMKQRCNNLNDKDYTRYGGRGIKVCDRWSDFMLFLEDMGERPTPKHSIDRIDNEGNYEPTNCRWATKKEQTHNSRVVKLSMVQADEIRKSYNDGGITQAALASKYNTHQSIVSRIINKEIW